MKNNQKKYTILELLDEYDKWKRVFEEDNLADFIIHMLRRELSEIRNQNLYGIGFEEILDPGSAADQMAYDLPDMVEIEEKNAS